MPVSASHLRRWVAAVLILVCVLVAGAYFYGRHRVKNALKQVPGKIGLEIQQSAQGFTISKSEQGRTLFKLQASKAVQFKSSGEVELHEVAVTLYGRDSSRFDQVYGKNFEYDPKSGDVTSQGEVQIDLQANPQGLLSSDQTPPKELKNPIHMRTTNLVFNKNSGDAWTPAEIDFSVPQASGSAVGAKYSAQTETLTLQSRIRIEMNGAQSSTLDADQAVLKKNPREILLRSPHAHSNQKQGQADELTLFLRDDNTLDHALAAGHVLMESPAKGVTEPTNRGKAVPASSAAADKLDVAMNYRNQVRNAMLSGNVHLVTEGAQRVEAWADRSEATFSGRNVLSHIHADGRVKLLQKAALSGAATNKSRRAQNVQVTAPAMDFAVAGGKRLTRAETAGPPEISLLPTGQQSEGQTHITADKFTATFDALGQLSRVYGEAHARVVTAGTSQNFSQPDRVSTSDTIDAFFRPGTGIETVTQQGHFSYSSGTQKAFADAARYTPANQIVALSGSPRVLDSGMETTADSVRLNRSNGIADAEGNVKTTYNDLKSQPNGALLAAADPIHVTAQSMTAQSSAANATYRGSVRLWQGANIIEAPVIEFQKDQRTVMANSNSGQPVSTILFATNKSGRTTSVNVTAARLIYRDSDRKAHYEGNVVVRSSDLAVAAHQMDVYLAAANAPASSAQSNLPARLEKIVATGSVVITQPTRRATGDQLTYTASDDKFVLTGGPPSIFDAEHGKITGVSLTLYRTDDRVIVDGDSRSPAVTHTRMER